jgi:TetR/AcrR family transcriptional regulator, lmrAB and yxaGH operons repressor
MAKDTRARMLETAARLLQHRGYYGTSLSDIQAESGAPRGSLYFHFPGGKNQLVVEATRAAVDETTAALRQTLAEASSPAQGVRAFVELVAGLMRASDYTFGCPVAPMILDATGGLDELAELCRQALEEWVRLLEEAFAAAGMPEARVGALALLVVSSIEGLLLVARVPGLQPDPGRGRRAGGGRGGGAAARRVGGRAAGGLRPLTPGRFC